MSLLSITLLGTPQITLDGIPVKMPTSRALPLVAYLALSEKPQSRETLANLLWSESNQAQALAALRTALWRLKTAGLGDWITLAGNEISLDYRKNIEVDVLKFKALIESCNNHGHASSQICKYCAPALTQAIELYHGEFMAGANITKASLFDDWRMQQSESLQTLHLNAIERLVMCHRTFGDFNLAIYYARIWLNYDRLSESAYYQLMQLYSITGQRIAGIALYKHYRELLSRELRVEPSAEIIELYKQILGGQALPASAKKAKTPVFLMADFESPALYWAKAGANKSETLETFSMIVRETARRFGGVIVQKTDNNVTMLFENGQPLHCAVTIHLKMKKADWGEPGPPNIRMVLYSTATEGNASSNFSMLTRTASSLLYMSWGGQIVFSDQTLRYLDIPSGSKVKDLGIHFLNDMDGSMHVYELIHPNLPAIEHPPLQSGTRQLINLPALSPPFFGREQELAELTQLFNAEENRLVSLVGPGGIGKTRLAVQFASQQVQYFPDGVFFISCASIQDPQYLPILLAEAIKFSFYGTRNHVDQLGDYLHGMKMLLVFDNFEHLRVESAKYLALLLSQTHLLKLLVTSRERLNMIAEQIMEVKGLPVPPADSAEEAENFSSIKLFLHNAVRTAPRFSGQSNLAEIIRICQLVDGIPLGILLASSWVKVFSCSEIASEINKNIDFLSTSAPDVDPRHRSLSVVFDNSWQLLTAEERRILNRISIFQSAFTGNAAQEICGASQLLLSAYLDKSLLFLRQDNRYEMLATLGHYAQEKLEETPEELDITKNRFCDYYADFCGRKIEELTLNIQRQVMEEMTSEIENIRKAWGWIIESDRWDLAIKMIYPILTYEVIIGNYQQAKEFFHLATIKLSHLNDPKLEILQTTILKLEAWMTIKMGFVTEGKNILKQCLHIFRANNSIIETAICLIFLAETNLIVDDHVQAKKDIDEAIHLFGDKTISISNYLAYLVTHCQSIRGTALLKSGDYEQARSDLQSSIATHNKIGSHYGTIYPLVGLARLAYIQGDFIQSRNLYLKALETAINLYDSRGIAVIHNNLSAVYEELANIPESYRYMQAALRYTKETGDRRLMSVILNNLAYHQMRYLNQPAEAIRTYQESLDIFASLGDLRGITYTCYDVSKAYLKVGLVDEARNYCLKSLRTAMTLDNTSIILHSMLGFVSFYINQKDYERALRLCNLIVCHPQVESDARKSAIVSLSEMETILPPDVFQSISTLGKNTSLQDAIDQLLLETNNPS